MTIEPPVTNGLNTPPGARWMRRIALLVTWVVLIGLAKLADADLTDWVTSVGVRERLSDWVATILNVFVYICFPAVFMGLPNWKRLFIGWNAALLLTTALTHLMKWSVGRARPFLGVGSFVYAPFSEESGMASFPSGHTSAAVAIAALAGMYFPRFRAVFWFYAAVVALERLVSRNHYLSDVIAGAGVGLFGVWVARRALGQSFFDPGYPVK